MYMFELTGLVLQDGFIYRQFSKFTVSHKVITIITISAKYFSVYLPNMSAKIGPTIAPINPPIAVIETEVDQIKSVIVTLRLVK